MKSVRFSDKLDIREIERRDIIDGKKISKDIAKTLNRVRENNPMRYVYHVFRIGMNNIVCRHGSTTTLINSNGDISNITEGYFHFKILYEDISKLNWVNILFFLPFCILLGRYFEIHCVSR